MTLTQLLQLRKAINKARPPFIRTQYGTRKRIKQHWRKPSGIHNKLKYGYHGKRKLVTVGYRGPAEVRELDRTGLVPIRVKQPSDIALLNPKQHGALIAKIGTKKRITIIQELIKKNITILNYKKPEEQLKKIQETFEKRKTEHKKTKTERKAAAKDRETVKPKETQKPTKEEAKKELDKVLTQGAQ